MKRLAYLLVAVFCAAMVQVQPADGLATKAKMCSCCHPGACGMPGCCPSAAPAPAALGSAQSARVVSASAIRRALPGRPTVEKFYAPFVEPGAPSPALVASAEAAPTANVPFFKAHCSFLI
jgi:hypothetical protein